jgi:hypothetical protein
MTKAKSNKNLIIKDSNALAEKKKNRSKTSRKKSIIRKDNSSPTRKTKVVQWNYKVNQLVKFRATGELGLIVADKQFHDRTLETNTFFILSSNRVLHCNGRDIVPIDV